MVGLVRAKELLQLPCLNFRDFSSWPLGPQLYTERLGREFSAKEALEPPGWQCGVQTDPQEMIVNCRMGLCTAVVAPEEARIRMCGL